MAIIFDTLKFANRLKAAGVKSEIAEAHAEAKAEAFADIFQVTTKHNIIELESKIDNPEFKLEQIKNELLIKLGGITVAVGGLLGVLLTIFHITR